MSTLDSSIKTATTSTNCPTCGEPLHAGTTHECAEDPTVGLDHDQPDVPPPPSQGESPGGPDLLLGTTLADRYTLIERLSKGGMGVVYKARHKILNSFVAVKILLKKENDIDQRRFLLEAQLASKIVHPNIVYISDYGLLPDGRPYLVMEYMEGPTLGRVLHKSPGHRIDMLRACKIAAQIAHGMQVVHDKGIVHRDLKPDNIFVLEARGGSGVEGVGSSGSAATVTTDFVKIVDFGIAKDTQSAVSTDLDAAIPAQQPQRPALTDSVNAAKTRDSGNLVSGRSITETGEDSESTPNIHQGLTRIGTSIGTPRYMAPEQVDGIQVDARADQYALGCILYQMIGGQVPFSAPSSMALLSMHLFEVPQSLRARYPDLGVPESLDGLIGRLLAKKGPDRWPSMHDVAVALEREIEVLSVLRGERVVVSSGLAALLGGRRGTHIIIRGRKLPLTTVLGVSLMFVAILSLGMVLGYRRWFGEPPMLKPGELQELEARARQVLTTHIPATTTPLELRLDALKGLAQTRDRSYRSQLEEALRDPSPVIQGKAADAIGQLGDPQGIPALLEQIKRSTNIQSQTAAAQALVQLGEPQGQAFLESLLSGAAEEGRMRAASLLCLRGHPKALSLLVEAIEQNRIPEPLRLGLLSCLTQTGNGIARQKLQQMMLAGDRQMALLAAARLAQLGHEEGRAFLREQIRQPGADQLVAARFLAAPDAPEVAELFRQVLRDPGAGTTARVLASEGLGSCGQLLDARLLGKQLKAKSDNEAQVAVSAASSIVLLAHSDPGRLSEQSLAWARGALNDGEWTVRESAVAVLGELPTPEAVPLLTTLLSDRHPAVRRSAAHALGRRREESALPALRIGLQDADTTVRQESLRSLLLLSRPLSSSDQLRQVLKDSASGWVESVIAKGSESEQTLARALLLRLGDPSQLAKLRELSRSADSAVRRMVIEHLDRELELLAEMLKDPVFAVRFLAAKRLAESNDRRGIPVLKESIERKGPESYSAIALLGKLGEPLLVPEGLIAGLGSGTVAERLSVLDALSAQAGESILPLLRRMARDIEPQVRRRTAEVAADLPVGGSGHPGVPILRLLATDSDPAVRARAQGLLAPFLRAAAGQAEPPPVIAADAPGPTAETARAAALDKATTQASDKAAVSPEPPRKSVEEPAKIVAAVPENPATDPAAGSGTLIVEASPIVQFQLDHGRWQTANKRGIVLTAGRHELASLSGTQQIDILENKTVTTKLSESQIEKLIVSGIEAHEKKDLRKAQKSLEKANSLCNRERKFPQPCAELLIDINFHLGQIHEASDRLPEAVTAYQKVVQGASRGHEDRKSAAQDALTRLLPNLGQVVIPKTVKKRCQEVTLYMLPGTHMIDIDGNQQTVKVRARETVKLGSCE